MLNFINQFFKKNSNLKWWCKRYNDFEWHYRAVCKYCTFHTRIDYDKENTFLLRFAGFRKRGIYDTPGYDLKDSKKNICPSCGVEIIYNLKNKFDMDYEEDTVCTWYENFKIMTARIRMNEKWEFRDIGKGK